MMKPLLLQYYITNRCNARCTFCDIWKEHPKKDAEKEHLFSHLVDARKAGCKFVDFTGGEPLLHPDLPLFLKKAIELGFITSVTTNTLLFPQRAEELGGLIDLLHFSIDADDPSLNDTMHGVQSYDSVMHSVPIALKHQLIPDLLFTYSDQNIESFMNLYTFSRKNRLMIILDPLFSLNGIDFVSPGTHKKALEYSKLPGVYLNKAHLTLRNLGGNSMAKPLCRAVSSTIVILPDNSLALPCYHQQFESIDLTPSLTRTLDHRLRKAAINEQGTYPFCQGCHINCYFDPSYSFLHNKLWVQSVSAKFFYALQKYFFYRRPFVFILRK